MPSFAAAAVNKKTSEVWRKTALGDVLQEVG